MRGFEFGGDQAFKVKTYPGFVLAFHWVNEDPAMVFFRRGGNAVYVLPLDNCHEIVRPGTKGEGVDGQALFHKATTAATVIGGDLLLARQIADAILENIDALCDMPPEPDWLILKRRAAPVGVATLSVAERVNGKRGDLQLIAEHEI